jgi:hypothetical protein
MQSVWVRKRFVLGTGSTGTFGDVTLTLMLLTTAKDVRVEWTAAEVDPLIRERAVTYATSFLRAYADHHSEYGFSATIAGISIDPERRNEPSASSILHCERRSNSFHYRPSRSSRLPMTIRLLTGLASGKADSKRAGQCRPSGE